jgi:hypothetical protein
MSNDPLMMGRLVRNPITPLHDEVAELLQKRVETVLRQSNVDMFLLGLTETDLIRFEFWSFCFVGDFQPTLSKVMLSI